MRAAFLSDAALVVTSTATIVLPQAALGATDFDKETVGQDSDGTNTEKNFEDIVVYGSPIYFRFDELPSDDELDRDDIDAYGFDNVSQIIEQISSEVQPGDEGPVILINGERATGINDVNDLPVEAVTKIQILRRDVANQFSANPSRRVINVVIKPDLVQITPNTQATLSTRGDAFKGDFELNLLKLEDSNRRSLVLRASHIDPLFEDERGIKADSGALPFDPLGNLVSSPVSGGEIDPLLSSAAGAVVVVAGLPANIGSPSLANFATTAGMPNRGGANAFRSLVSDTNSYSANGNISQRLSDKTNLLLNSKIERNESDTLRGLSPATLRVPAISPFSPFGREVGLAYLLGEPLRSRQKFTNIDIAQALNTQVGKFGISARATFVHRVLHVATDRSYDFSALQTAISAGSQNPFAAIPTLSLGPVRTDFTRSRSDSANFQISANGPLFELPAGPAQLSATARVRFDRAKSDTQGLALISSDLNRDEVGTQANISLPLFRSSSKKSFSLTADISGQFRRIDNSGSLRDWGFSLNGDIGKPMSFSASISQEQIAPPTSSLNDPLLVIENFRTYDFIRQQTVLVQNIVGGNPDLPIQRRRTISLQANFRPFSDNAFLGTAEYLKISNRDIFSPLPPVSSDVQTAFPDRFIRDVSGQLIRVDARPVTFLRDESEKVRWGFKFRKTYGGTAIGEDDAEGPSATKGRGVRVNFDLTHDWTLVAKRQARAALPEIDLLRGGAIGYGGGLIRHSISFNAGLASRGVGLQVNGQYRGSSYLTAGTIANPSRLTFEDRTPVNARLFANLGPILSGQKWAKGLRISLQATNLFDSKQRVRDDNGGTPLRYQPFLIDPVGRSLTLGIRKVF